MDALTFALSRDIAHVKGLLLFIAVMLAALFAVSVMQAKLLMERNSPPIRLEILTGPSVTATPLPALRDPETPVSKGTYL